MSALIPRTRDLPKHDSNGRPYTAQEMNDMEAEREFMMEEMRMEAEMDADAENYTNELRGECDWMVD